MAYVHVNSTKEKYQPLSVRTAVAAESAAPSEENTPSSSEESVQGPVEINKKTERNYYPHVAWTLVILLTAGFGYLWYSRSKSVEIKK